MQNQQQTQQPVKVKRTFIPGDEWLYYKIYTGPKTADIVLSEVIQPLADQMLAAGVIDRWFFIRYGDPKMHIRVRFHFNGNGAAGQIVPAVKQALDPFVAEDLVWKVMMDTYQREIERYTPTGMELAEEMFFHDSRMIAQMIGMIEGDEGETIRWLFSLRCIDQLLKDFQYTMEDRRDLMEGLKTGFGREFGMNKALREQLKSKFRKERPLIEDVMDYEKDEESEMLPLFDLLRQKSEATRPVVERVLALHKEDKLGRTMNDLMGSYIHMLNNRLFKSKQRIHEMVVYDFLWNYYKSTIARRKYDKSKK